MSPDEFPPGLSIREQQVFRLVREGRMDSEIAVRLGLGTGEVKQTVAVLMSKCGVSDRAGIVAWQPGPAPRERRPMIERIADRMGATVGGLVVALIVFGMGGIFLWRSLPGDDDPVSLVDADATPTGTVGGVLRDGVYYEPLTYLDPVDFPRDTVMYVTTGCGLCEWRGLPGNSPELVRIYRDGDGAIREDVLFGDPPGDAYIVTWAAGNQYLAVTVCTTGACSTDMPGYDPHTALYQSTDGGVTWDLTHEWDENVQLAGAALGPDLLLMHFEGPDRRRFEWLQTGDELVPPAGADPLAPPLLESGIQWRAEDGHSLLNSDGTLFVDATAPVIARPLTATWPTIVSLEGQGQQLTAWILVQRQEGPRGYTGGALYPGPFVRGAGIYSLAYLPRAMTDRAVLTLPATFTPEDGIVIPIAEPFKDWPVERRTSTRILAVRQMDNIARVITDGECAPVVASTGHGGTQLACYAPGVLISVAGNPLVLADGTTWWRIDDLVGGPGFISDEHVQP